MTNFSILLAGVKVFCTAQFPETPDYFKNYDARLTEYTGGAFVTDTQKAVWDTTGKPDNAFAEFSMLSGGCSDALMTHGRCLVHAVAFRYSDKAFLFTAPPGVGKSTQVRTLMELYPGRFSVICGDRPILECRDDGTVFVHPSPWNGKENWHGADGAVLSGILCLERGEKTQIDVLTQKQAVLPVLRAVISNHESEKTIKMTAALTEHIIRSCPVYRYINGGVPESTRILYQRLFAE